MSESTTNKNLVFIAGILGMLTALGFAYSFYESSRPEPAGYAVGAERKAKLNQLESANEKALKGYSAVEGKSGVYNLPIDRAMEIVVAEWENPIDGRRKLLQRAQKAAAAGAP